MKLKVRLFKSVQLGFVRGNLEDLGAGSSETKTDHFVHFLHFIAVGRQERSDGFFFRACIPSTIPPRCVSLYSVDLRCWYRWVQESFSDIHNICTAVCVPSINRLKHVLVPQTVELAMFGFRRQYRFAELSVESGQV